MILDEGGIRLTDECAREAIRDGAEVIQNMLATIATMDKEKDGQRRGTVVIDENLANLAPFLEKKGIRVRLPPKGMSDEKIAEDYLPNRIFITNNSKDFIDMASEYDIGIIATENVLKDPEHLAKNILH